MFPSRIREAVRHLDYDLETKGTADTVLAALRAYAPAVILINLNARRFDALNLIRELKALPASAAIPVIAFAGHVETEKHEAARNAGADLVAANSSVSLHLTKLLQSVLGGERTENVIDASP